MKILISGDRNWADKELIFCTLLDYVDDVSVVIEGGARGADTLGRLVAEDLSISVIHCPANWNSYGKRAGIMRNIQMLEEHKPDLILAFHDDIEISKGTKHMIETAKAAFVEVRLITHYD